MRKTLSLILASCMALSGCASFYSEKQVPVAAPQAKLKRALEGKTVGLQVYGLKCPESPELQHELTALAKNLGMKVLEGGRPDYQLLAGIKRCDGFYESFRKGSSIGHYALFSLSMLLVPYFYDEDLQIELILRRGGKELYTAQQGAKAFVISGWFAAPSTITNRYGQHVAPMIRGILAKHLVEIEEQGVLE